MRRGPKPELPSEKAARGTLQPVRDAGRVDILPPDALPVEPEWLPPEAREVWLDDIGRVAAGKLASEQDSTAFANYCCLQAMVTRAWKSGEPPPAAYLSELRKQQEQFGLAGRKSRLTVAPGGATGVSSNPFSRNGRR